MGCFLVQYIAFCSIAFAGYISSPLSVTRPQHLLKRDVHGAFVANNVFYYTTEIQIGTPPQPISVVLDTGSADLWVMKSTNPYCSGKEELCDGKIFDSSNSSTFEPKDSPFYIRYGDSSSATGDWAHDDVHIAGAVLKQTTFAVASTSNSTQIVMGVGLPSLESTVNGVDSVGGPTGSYQNIPQLFKDQGHIERVAYSLWLNDIDSRGGSILFGGIDRSRYEGDLTLLLMVNLSNKLKNPYSFHIMINSLSVETGRSVFRLDNLAYPALLDSGTSFGYLPPDFVQFLATPIKYKFHSDSGYYLGSCAQAAGKTLTVNFSGKDIPIPYSSLVMPYSHNDPETCALVVLPSHNAYSTILGDIFLRNLYVVFDLENYEIGIAPSRLNATDSDIIAISDGIPGVRAPLYDPNMAIRNVTFPTSAQSAAKLAKERSQNTAARAIPDLLLCSLFFLFA